MKLSLPVGNAGQRNRGFTSTHAGIDYGWYNADPTNSQRTYAAAPGKVLQVINTSGWGDGWGSRVVIEHAPGVLTTYNHYWVNGIKVRPGQLVSTKTYLGQMGSTGKSDGVHLHFELYINGARVDPAPYFSKDLPGTSTTPAGGGLTHFPETELESDMRSIKHETTGEHALVGEFTFTLMNAGFANPEAKVWNPNGVHILVSDAEWKNIEYLAGQNAKRLSSSAASTPAVIDYGKLAGLIKTPTAAQIAEAVNDDTAKRLQN